MAKYKVGDKVRVRTGLKGGKYYDELLFSTAMEELCGKELTVELVNQRGWYKVEENHWTFNDTMLEDVTPKSHKYKVGDKVRIRTDLVGENTYGGVYFPTSMERFHGKEMAIKEIIPTAGRYKLVDGGGWTFSEAMFEDVSTYKFKVGDKVRLKKSLEVGKAYDGIHLLDDMVENAKGVQTISMVYEDGCVELHKNYYTYTSEMFELADDSDKPSDIPTIELKTQNFVRVTVFNHYWCPTKGVEAILIDELPDGRLVIDLGFKAPFTTTCDGRCKTGTAYFEHKKNVVVVG